jgi:hypothetical protein
MKILNPDRDRWMTSSEAFNAIGQRKYGDAWDKREVDEADWDIPDHGPTKQDYIDLGYSVGEVQNDLSPAEREALAVRQVRAATTKDELRLLLYKSPVQAALLIPTGDCFKVNPGQFLACILRIENGWADLLGANGEIRISGLLLIDRAQFLKAVAPSGAKGLRDLLQTTEANGSRMTKVKLLEVAEIYGVSKAAAKEIWKKYARDDWKVGGRPRSDPD